MEPDLNANPEVRLLRAQANAWIPQQHELCRCIWERPPRDAENRDRQLVEIANDCVVHGINGYDRPPGAARV